MLNKFSSFEKFIGSVDDLEYLTKGWRGKIFVGYLSGEKIAIKVPREKKFKDSILREVDNLKQIQEFNFVPKLVSYGEDYFAYKFIEGVSFSIIYSELEDKFDYVKRLLIIILENLYKFDLIGLKKNELSNLSGNILVSGENVNFIDFEKARFNKPWTNIPQFLQFLKKKRVFSLDDVMELGYNYEKSPEKIKDKIVDKLIAWRLV